MMSPALAKVHMDVRPPIRKKLSSERMKVLMVAFACGPNRGSEPGQGWNFAKGMADTHDVWVLAYAGFRKVIEKELALRPVSGLNVEYYRLPFENRRHWEEGIDRGGLAEQLHYYFWNLGAGALARTLDQKIGFDLVHHVSFMRYWSPSAAASVEAPFLWGPVGGGESAPKSFYASFGWKGFVFEFMRDAVRTLASLDPFVRRTAHRATVTLATTDQTAARIRQVGGKNISVNGSVALRLDEIDRLGQLSAPKSESIRFISVGRILHWKGYGLGIRAFAKMVTAAPGDPVGSAEYWIVGDGPERSRLETLASELGVGKQVHFTGRISRNSALDELSKAHVFVHPSFHDSGGYASLEAMAAGKPVICLALGGPGLQVTPECGVAVAASSPKQTVDDLSEAMQELASNRTLRENMGRAARARVAHEFSWEVLLDNIQSQYNLLVGAARFVSNPT